MSVGNVKKAILTRYLSLGISYPLATENEEFDPSIEAPNGETWCKFTFSPNTPEVKTLGTNGEDEVTGFAQFDINIKPGTSDSETFDYYETLRLAFSAGSYLTYGSDAVLITSCGLSQGRRLDEIYRKSVRIFWRSDITRNS